MTENQVWYRRLQQKRNKGFLLSFPSIFVDRWRIKKGEILRLYYYEGLVIIKPGSKEITKKDLKAADTFVKELRDAYQKSDAPENSDTGSGNSKYDKLDL